MRGAGRLAVVTLEDQLLVMTRLRIRLGWLQQELAYIFGVSEAGVSLTFQEKISFLYFRLGQLPPWPSWKDVKASMAEFFCDTLTHLLSWIPQNCALKLVAVWPCSCRFVLLTKPHNAEGLDWYFPEWLDLLCQ